MKHTRQLAMVMVVLLSVCIVGASLAEQAMPEIIVEQTEFFVETTPSTAVQTTEAASDVATTTPEASIETASPETPVPSETPPTTLEPEVSQDPATTEEPEQNTTEEPEQTPSTTDEPELATTQEPTPATEQPTIPVVRSVSILMDVPANLVLGDIVTLTATLTGYEGCTLALQWQYTFDGEHWFDAEGANSLTYAFAVAESNAGTGWRLAVSIL